jgi:DNA-binding MarR family transcriptional regulator
MPDEHADLTNKDKVLLSSTDAIHIARLLQMLVPGGAPFASRLRFLEQPERFEAQGKSYPQQKLKDLARRIYIRRRTRSKFLPEDYFREPAWDMLLALYAGSEIERRQMVSGLVTFTSVPPTTALRYISALEEHGHVVRQPSAEDGRVNFVNLTDRGHAAVSRYLACLLDMDDS